MKKLKTTLLLISVIVLFKTSIGQQTTLLTDSTNIWYEYGQYGGYLFYPIQHDHLWYFFKGDTLINGVNYKQLHYDRKDTTYYNPIVTQNSKGYFTAFRQDSLKVFFIDPNTNTEKLYCDFNLVVGDTLKYYYNPNKNVIDTITSIAFGSSVRKRYKLNNGHNFYDGIGNGLGLFHDFGIGIEGGGYLVCFEQLGITENVYDLWWASSSPVCQTYLPISIVTENMEYFQHNKNITITPNPFLNELNITFSNDEQLLISLYNNIGEKKYQGVFYKNLRLDTDNLSSGIYFFEIKSSNGTLKSGKIIKH